MAADCGYSHDVSGERFDDIDGSEWVCSRPAASGLDRCTFHAPPERVDGELQGRIRAAVRGEDGPIRLIGADIASLDLDYAIVGGASNHPIDLREATVEGALSLRFATVERPIRLEGARLAGRVDFEDAIFTRRVDLGRATFEGVVSFRMTDFESWVDVREATFERPVYARVARFQRGIYGVDATFHDAADFLNATFDDVANFYRATFHHGAIFDRTTFEGNAQFIEATLHEPAVKLESASGSPRSAAEEMTGVALSVDGATCNRDLRLTDTTVDGDVQFTDSDLDRDLRCRGVTATDSIVVDCTGSSVVSGSVTGDDGRITYDLTDATLGDVTIDEDTSVEVFRFDETTFDGFDFSAYKQTLANRDWQLHDPTVEADPERRENLYLRAKNGAKEIGESRGAGEFFVREMRYRRVGHRQRIGKSDGAVATLRAAGSWTANVALELTCGYGERPLRPFVFSLGIVLTFSGVFAVLDPPLSYPGPLGYVVFSLEGFISLILGLPSVADTFLGFVVALEGFLGAFMIALFVFALTRSISR